MNEKLEYLSKKDPILGRLIDIIGQLALYKREDHYISLVKSIIGQQLSVKAAGTIIARFMNFTGCTITPDKIIMFSDETLREIGISYRKIKYIKDLSQKVLDKEIKLEALDKLSNEEVINTLTNVKGIGIWTAEMFLIFSLGRENVLSLLDVGLQRGAKWLYNCSDGKTTLMDKGTNWFPYTSIASLYLWEAVNRGFVNTHKSFDDFLLNHPN
ncbi:DNA-3-methyladenine glycosylase 2 family protein [Priestia megaterium]|uniref:DNA-3-methyladenine glycosylase II n=1 Tax=Priestia megaterium TaxID=1404 RepID=A0A6H1P2W5_PRIMG|nr:DNA-3-methyladenine glycosylase 2 family protein [Priestia megaterium]QIZ07621.1 DNA-3-methyladenine glycosylase 2 family protein [Priestia megaterium]